MNLLLLPLGPLKTALNEGP